jgi:hypothetical protein
MMRLVKFGRWSLNSDAGATRERYAALATGAPEKCGCSPCRNFAAQRAEIYPPAVQDLFGALGINANREAEVSHFARLASGRHLYGGWFHFVGAILDGRDAAVQVAENVWQPELQLVTDRFKMGFTSRLALVAEPFKGLQLAQLEFSTELPWTLESGEPQ